MCSALHYSVDLDHLIVSYDEIIDNPKRLFDELFEWFAERNVSGLDAAAAAETISPGLRRERSQPEDDNLLTETQKTLWERLSARQVAEPRPRLSQRAREVLQEFEADQALIERLRAQITSQGTKLKRLETQTVKLNAGISQQQGQANEPEIFRETTGIHEQRLAQLQDHIETLKSERADHRARLREFEIVRDKLTEKQAELKQARDQTEGVQAELANALQNISLMESAVAEHVEKIKELKKARSSALDDAADLRKQRDALQAEKERAGRETRKLETDRDALRTETDRLQTRENDLSEKLKAQEILIKRQQERIGLFEAQFRRLSKARVLKFSSRLRFLPLNPLEWSNRLALRRRANRIIAAGLFDSDWYLQQYPDVLHGAPSPVIHYLTHGAREGRWPHPVFDPDWYASQLEGEYFESKTPVEHYLDAPPEERVSPHRLFDQAWYLENNPDVGEDGCTPLTHFLLYGGAEGRLPHSEFDVSRYLGNCPDVSRSRVNPLVKFLTQSTEDDYDSQQRLSLQSFPDRLEDDQSTLDKMPNPKSSKTSSGDAGGGVREVPKGQKEKVVYSVPSAKPQYVAERFKRIVGGAPIDPATIPVHIIVYSSAPGQKLRLTLEALQGLNDTENRFLHLVIDWSAHHSDSFFILSQKVRVHSDRDCAGFYPSIKKVMGKVGKAHFCVIREGTIVEPKTISALADACVGKAWCEAASPLTNSFPAFPVAMRQLESVRTAGKRLALINGEESGLEAPMLDLDVFMVCQEALKVVPFPAFAEDLTDQSLVRFFQALRAEGLRLGVTLGSYALTNSPRTEEKSSLFHVSKFIQNDAVACFEKDLLSFSATAESVKQDIESVDPVISERKTVCVLLSSLLLRGGVIVLVNWINQLIFRGFDVRVYVQHVTPGYEVNHNLIFRPKPFVSTDEIVAELPVGSDVVATFWPTAELAEEIVARVPKARGYYFIQDYEVDFYPKQGLEEHLREMVRQSYKCDLKMVVTSKWIATKLVDNEGVDKEKISRIPVGIDHILFPPRQISRPLSAEVVITAMARPETPRRGFQLLRSALEQVKQRWPAAQIVLFGSDELEQSDFSFPCELLGVVAPEKLHGVYARADIFVDTSDFQGFGLAPLEAMASGCACVITDSGGVSEYARNELNALLVRHDSEAISDAISTLISDSAFRASLSAAAIETAKKFDCSHTADEWAALLDSSRGDDATDQPSQLAVVVPIFNQLHAARRCIESVLKSGLNGHKLVLVDDCSDSHTASALAKYADAHHDVVYLRNEVNLGFVGAANRGMAWAADRSMDVILLNSDTIVVWRWLDRLRASAYANKKIGIVSPLSTESSHLFLVPRPGDSFIDADHWLTKHVKPRYPTVITPEGWCLFIKHSVYQVLGGFDTVFGRGYCEESDYCMRAVAAGFRLAVCENLMVFHEGKVTFGNERSQRYLENRKIFDHRWYAVYKRMYDKFLKLDPLHSVRERYANDKPVQFSSQDGCPDLLGILDDPETAKELAEFESRTHQQKTRVKIHNPRMVVILPTLQPYGGTLSTVMLVNSWLLQGRDIKVVVLSLKGYQGNTLGLLTQPIFLTSKYQFFNHFPQADIVIGTLWITMYYAARLAARRPALEIGYYVQDFEAAFPDVTSRNLRDAVLRTYSWDVRAFAKTDWICSEVRKAGANISLVSPALDPDVFYPRDSILKRGDGRKRVIGMLRPNSEQRSPETLLRAFVLIKNKLPETEILVFGCTDEELAGTRTAIVDRNLGIVDNSKLPEVYAECDVFLDGSLFHGFGRVIAEAMACGLSCAITDSGGVSEFVEPGGNCFVSPVGDPQALADNALRLLSDDDLLNAIGRRGRECSERFPPSRSAQEIFECLTRR